MEARLLDVRCLLGDQHDIKDAEIRETLWYYYFDVEQTVAWLLGSRLARVEFTSRNTCRG